MPQSEYSAHDFEQLYGANSDAGEGEYPGKQEQINAEGTEMFPKHALLRPQALAQSAAANVVRLAMKSNHSCIC